MYKVITKIGPKPSKIMAGGPENGAGRTPGRHFLSPSLYNQFLLKFKTSNRLIHLWLCDISTGAKLKKKHRCGRDTGYGTGASIERPTVPLSAEFQVTCVRRPEMS